MESVYYTTSDRLQVPRFMYGTAWKEDRTEDCVRRAIAAGFRAIDTANQRKHYLEAGVGEALLQAYEAHALNRADFFIQTKFTHMAGQDSRLPYDPSADISVQVVQSFQSSCQHLHTYYIDSYILHGPSRRFTLADQDWQAWRAMEQLKNDNRVKTIGVSNVDIGQLRELWSHASIKPSFVQNRCFAQTGWDFEVRTFCNQNHIVYQGFSLLTANAHLFGHATLRSLCHRYQCTAAQLIFSFALHVGMVVLTGTTDSKHMQEDLEASRLSLDQESIASIENISGE